MYMHGKAVNTQRTPVSLGSRGRGCKKDNDYIYATPCRDGGWVLAQATCVRGALAHCKFRISYLPPLLRLPDFAWTRDNFALP